MRVRQQGLTILTAALSLTIAAVPPSGIHALEPGSDPGPTKRVRADQWHLTYLNVGEAQRITRGAGVTVAVPDTGVQPHPDLRDNLLDGTDVISGGDGNGQDDLNSHGTGMAGLIAAHGQGENLGALGIAPEAKILPIRDTPGDGQGQPDDLAASIDYAVRHGANVICISSTGGAGITLQRSIEAALAADVVLVASVGNAPQDTVVGYPASAHAVIAVGGIGRNGMHSAISTTGPEVDVVAPAVDIYSTSIDGKYRKGTGTSDATAIVAGAAALIRSKYPHLPAQEVAHRLTATAVDKGPPGRDDEYGYGVIDLVAALTADVPPLGFESVSAPAGGGASTTAGARPGDDDGATVRGLATLGVIVAAGVGWALVLRRRRRGDDPPPRISR
ncbi:S8 family serine peptidase [Micromonospora sp. NPDC000316]|uniref:S8 family serine peptidase n=1 Tax=Micromonospora sp. NPDC000316 TaxID=3364216 RepID=UPI0036C5559B